MIRSLSAPFYAALCFALCCILQSCSEESTQPTDTSKVIQQSVVQHYGNIVLASYSDALASAQDMKIAIANFTQSPNEASFMQAKKAWLEARNWYGQTEVFRFYGGPIDDENGPEGLLNAWPLDESYIDYVVGNPEAGVINNTKDYPIINEALIEQLNEQGGETNISSGYHAIEFLLWGQDITSPSQKLPGQRPLTDFTTEKNAQRRKEYINIVADMIIGHLSELVAQWSNNSNNYRTKFLNQNTDSSLTSILQGMSSLTGGELSGERMTVALGKGEQEDEHSCFSDNTHNDIIMNQKGIENIWLGVYKRRDGSLVTGKGIYSLIEQKNAVIAQEVQDYFNKSNEKISQIQAPFDYEISQGNSAGNQRVAQAITALQKQAFGIVKVAETLNIRLNLE
ncbi:MAG TPA: imelysin family protein [Candidatus Kapabacteria bacterium]|nr:imelysin family protein [Candidatus Kapabacteria bacterium]